MDKRMVDQEFHNEDTDLELSLRPTQLKQYIGPSTLFTLCLFRDFSTLVNSRLE
jgi:Holliday junction resolvasome RuvABC ATP-dependent DNA helicase subunit